MFEHSSGDNKNKNWEIIYHSIIMAKYPAALYWLPQDNPSCPILKYSATVKIGNGNPLYKAFLKLFPIWSEVSQ